MRKSDSEMLKSYVIYRVIKKETAILSNKLQQAKSFNNKKLNLITNHYYKIMYFKKKLKDKIKFVVEPITTNSANITGHQ